LLGNELEAPIHLVLAPASHIAANTSPIAELVAELVSARGQTCRVHIGMVHVDVSVGVEDRKVVAKTAVAHLWVLEDPSDGVLFMLGLLG